MTQVINIATTKTRKEFIAEAAGLAAKIRTTLAKLTALTTSLQETERQKRDCQAKIEAAVSSGGLEDAKVITSLSEENSRLLLFPTRMTQLENALEAAQKALPDYLVAVNVVLGNIKASLRSELQREISQSLSKWISEDHRVVALTQEVLRFSDRLNSVEQASAPFTHSQIQAYQQNSESIIPLAALAADVIESHPEFKAVEAGRAAA